MSNTIPTIYLASPFFNDKQRAEVERLTRFVEDNGWRVLSPSRDGLVIKPDDPPEVSKKGFDWNVDAIRRSNAVLAFMDWLTPDGCEIREVSFPKVGSESKLLKDIGLTEMEGVPTKEHPTKLTKHHSPPLNIPDAGVIFEIGTAYAHDIPVITLTYSSKPLNLMMIHSVIAHCSGEKALAELEDVLLALQDPVEDRNTARTQLHDANSQLLKLYGTLRSKYAFKGKII